MKFQRSHFQCISNNFDVLVDITPYIDLDKTSFMDRTWAKVEVITVF